jgi:hypothetical protein
MTDDIALVEHIQLPVELHEWTVVRRQNEAAGKGFIIWLERKMPDGTVLRMEVSLSSLSEIPMIVPILLAVARDSAPGLRLSVTRTKADRFVGDRRKHRPRLTG